jgi:hypothetical protein
LPFALSSVNVTVWGSVAFAPPGPSTPFSPALPAATRRSIVATTSADVKGDPSAYQVAPVRSLNVQTVPSAFGVHSVASPGASPPGSSPIVFCVARNSNDCAVMP